MTRSTQQTPVEVATALVGDAWTVLVLREAVLIGTRKFVDFRESLDVNRSTLIDRLDHLVDSGLLAREAASATSERTVYGPTSAANAYSPVLLSMLNWGRRWRVPTSEGPLIHVEHRTCGAALIPIATCGCCCGPLDPRTVDVPRPPSDVQRIGPDTSQRMPHLDQLERGHECPIARCLTSIGDRWSMLIIQEAFFGLHTFEAFRQRLGIASNTLSNRLSRLCEHGILDRLTERGRPFYRLTEKGLDLYSISATTWQWAIDWLGADDDLGMLHRWCGARVSVVTRCAHCGEAVEPGTVRSYWAERPD